MSRVEEYWMEETQTWYPAPSMDQFMRAPGNDTYIKTDDGWTICIEICTIYDETPEDFTMSGPPHLHILRYKDE